MKICKLIKKDILLAGSYFVFSLIIVLIMPIYLSYQGVSLSSLYLLLVSISFSIYFVFNNIFMVEDKFKGNLYLMSIPYKIKDIVVAKYFLALLFFFLELLCYFFLSEIIHLVKPRLTFSTVSIVFFVLATVLSIFFPLYFRYSYTKIKIALLVVLVFVPTWGIVGVTYLLNKRSISDAPQMSTEFSALLLLLGIIILLLSVELSNIFLKKRDF